MRIGPLEIGAGLIGRWTRMDESDEEDNLIILGHDTEFIGFLISGGVVF